ncbi:WD40-repeat-containing domain protein [Vararia minispora EC-137]|uniref:WD40-repeat-containing domain protein n=1 Tax=Vararia minispora EC-137 TaxID=1314806 RepID=A0ACB8QM87_9AGAM|nr:WD40-repeat-containing domain protein [Vararia minispora EC-137]
MCSQHVKRNPGAQLNLRGHRGGITCIATSTDRKRIFSGSADNTIRVWDAQTGSPMLLPLTGHKDEITGIILSTDDTCLVSGSLDGFIRVWNPNTGVSVLTLIAENRPAITNAHDGPVTSVIFSGDGLQLVTGSSDSTLRTWNVHAIMKPQLRSNMPDNAHGQVIPRGQNDIRHLSLSEDCSWVLGPSGELIFWVPPEYRPYFQCPPCQLLTSPHSRRVLVDFSQCGTAHGTNWTQCYSPNAT